MKNIRYAVLYVYSWLRRYRWFLLAAVILIGLISLWSYFSWHSLQKKDISQGLVGTYTPNDIPPSVSALFSRGLVSLDASGSAQPDLAISWEANKEANQYTFHLKPDLYWTDGVPLKAADIKISIPEVEVTTPDDQTIVFTLSDSFSPFPTLLSKPVVRKDKIIGVGPYKITQVTMSSVFVKQIKLASNDPDLPNLSVNFYPNEKTAKSALRSGEVQSVIGLSEYDGIFVEKPFKYQTTVSPTRLVAIFYNTKDPILSDENFRLALSFAAPSITNEKVAVTTIPDSSWAFNAQVRDFLDNPTQAKNYIDKVKVGKDQPVILTVTSSLETVGQQVVQEWNNQGILAELKVESGIPQNFQALLISQDIPADPDQYSLWHGTQIQTNISQFSQPRVDKDLEDGRKLTDQKQRLAAYQDFQKTLLDHAPTTPLYFPKNYVAYLKKIEPELAKVLPLQLPHL